MAGWLRATLDKAPPMRISTVTVCQLSSSKSEIGRHSPHPWLFALPSAEPPPQELMSSQMVAPFSAS